MSHLRRLLRCAAATLLGAASLHAQIAPNLPNPSAAAPHSRAARGMPEVTVSQANGEWSVIGQKLRFTLKESDLALRVVAGATTWAMAPSTPGELMLKAGDAEFPVRLVDAQKITFEPYDTGFKTGVKITLDQWKRPDGAAVSLPLYLTLALEGGDDELAFTVAADETHGAVVRTLNWPAALDASAVDHTILNHYRGILLPRTWPEAYNPIRGDNAYPKDSSEIQSDVVECWSQPWWGFQQGAAAMMVLIETTDDAAYQWSHPAGGPTVIGPRWRPQLGRLGYPRGAA